MISTATASAHGRVNLIGEHTDYNGGFVLPASIPQAAQVNLRRCADPHDQRVTMQSLNIENSRTSFVLGEERRQGQWLDYVQGVTKILVAEGHRLAGFEGTVSSSVPMGSGLSSSAALEVALLKALNELFELKLSEIEIAKFGQRVENEFVGAHVGIMDQMAASLGRLGEALFIDTRDLTFRRVPLPPEQIRLLVINSGVVHNHALGDYNQRRAECEQACRLLGIRELRDLKFNDLDQLRTLPVILQKRARHVVTENARVLEAVAALERHHLSKLGELFSASHASMRDDYQVSIPEIDTLVEISESFPEIFGARLTGGGFGGSIVALADGKLPQTSLDAVASEIVARYASQTGQRATVLGRAEGRSMCSP